jgi:hypothetical protein
MTEESTYKNRKMISSDKEEITFQDMLILSFQIQNDMKTTKKLLQSIMEGSTPKNSTPTKSRNPKQNTVPSMNQKIMNSDWMTTKEVMQWLGKSKRTLQNYRNEGKIPFKTFNRCIYYSKREIEKCFDTNDIKQP